MQILYNARGHKLRVHALIKMLRICDRIGYSQYILWSKRGF
jgi:hypothetical protein